MTPTTPPPSGPPPGYQQQPSAQSPQQVPAEWRHPSGWWWDGRKWRPPVPQLTRWQLIQQVPGALLKLTFLVILLGFLLVFLWGMLFGK